jgi:tetratricopeptide (TPR) repeat protein
MEAESLLLHALEMLQVSGEAESLSGARCLYQLALTQTALGNSASALSFMRNAIAMYHAIDIRACPPGLFESLAQAYTEAGQPAEAEKILNMMLAWAHEKFGPFEPETADVIQQLADLHCASGKQEQASAEYYQALQIYQRSAGCEEKFKQLDKKLATAAGGK